MDVLHGALELAFRHPGFLVGLAIVALIAGRLLVHPPRWPGAGRADRLSDDAAGRFEIATRAQDPEIDIADEIARDIGRLIAADRWDLVHSLIAAWERDRAATPFGTMFHRIGADTALKPLYDIAAAEAATGIRSAPHWLDRQLDAFVSRMTAAPDDHVAAALAARAHLAAGWAARDDGRFAGPSDAALARMARHHDSAERILARFATRGSSLVAEARYLACLGLEDGDRLIRRRYDDWIAIDPDDVTPFQVHGTHLLPGWFGTFVDLEAEARRAADLTRRRRGAAGYAIFHGGIMACGARLPRAWINPRLFVEAALDRARTAGGQWGVNRTADMLLAMMRDTAGETRGIYREGLTRLVHEHLQVLIPDAWSAPPDEVRRELAWLFRRELETGGRVRVTPRGVEILPPEDRGGAAAAA